jgi:glycosyltransferase involved in cell wall biosynthesis
MAVSYCKPESYPLAGRILLVIDTLGRGGAEQVLVNLLPRLIERGFECGIAVTRSPYDLAPDLEREGVPVYRLDISNPWNLPVAVRRLAGVIRRTRPDVVHSSLLFSILYTALTKPFIPAVSRIATFQNVDYYLYPADSVAKRCKKALDIFVSRHWIDCCTAVSGAVAEYCAKELGLRSVAIIPNAVPSEPLVQLSEPEKSSIRIEYECAPDEFVMAMVGRLVLQKGHATLLEALQILAERDLRPKVIMVGGGPLRAAIDQLIAKAGLASQVMIKSPMEHDRVMRLLRVVDAFVMPSLYEGLPLAAAEAMSLGMAVVATRVTGLSELIEHGISGLLVPPKDPHALAEAIARLVGDSRLRRELGQAARKRVERHYSVGVVSGQWHALYRDLVGQRCVSPG